MPNLSFGTTIAEVTGRMLKGHGVKSTDLVWNWAQMGPDEKEVWVDPSWTFETPGDPPGPADYLFPGKQLDSFFRTPENGN
jgi:hypothetical protein